jgi:hypothetical protein
MIQYFCCTKRTACLIYPIDAERRTDLDPVVIDLTTKIMAVLLPFVSKGAEEFASKVGDAAFEKAKAILATLKQKWSGDKEATETLTRFEAKPERYKTVLEDILQEKLVTDNDLVLKLTRLLQEVGPSLKIVQQMEEGKNITGLEATQMKRGAAEIIQDVTRAEGVIGARFDTIG